MNRLLTRTVNAASGVTANNVSFTYTASGRRQTMTDASGTTTYGYDSRDRLETKATPQGTLIYGYDDASNLTSITTNTPDGASMTYDHDELNRLDSVIDGNTQETTYAYDANGNLSGVGLPNGIISGYQYNAANRLTSLAHVNAGGTVASFTYGLNPTGHRREAVETGQGINMIALATERIRVWAYDNLWRLQNETLAAGQANANGSVSYGLDSVGNRLSRSSSIPGLISQSFSYNVNDRLDGNTYDANGNTKAAPASQVVTTPNAPAPVTGTDQYNSSNQLTTRNAPNGDTVQLVYDGDGNKVCQITTRNGMTTTTTYLVDDMNPTGYAQVIEEKTNGQLTKVYTFGHDLISLDQFTAGNWNLSYYGYDGHGSVRYLSNALGQVTDTYDYDAFGSLLSINGTTPNSYLYCGESYDPDLGLYYLRARLMNPLTGRFWTADSYEGMQQDPASLHKYLYCGHDGVNASDPSGHRTLVEMMVTTWNVANIAASVGGAMLLGYRVGTFIDDISTGEIDTLTEACDEARDIGVETLLTFGGLKFGGIVFSKITGALAQIRILNLGQKANTLGRAAEIFISGKYTMLRNSVAVIGGKIPDFIGRFVVREVKNKNRISMNDQNGQLLKIAQWCASKGKEFVIHVRPDTAGVEVTLQNLVNRVPGLVVSAIRDIPQTLKVVP